MSKKNPGAINIDSCNSRARFPIVVERERKGEMQTDRPAQPRKRGMVEHVKLRNRRRRLGKF